MKTIKRFFLSTAAVTAALINGCTPEEEHMPVQGGDSFTLSSSEEQVITRAGICSSSGVQPVISAAVTAAVERKNRFIVFIYSALFIKFTIHLWARSRFRHHHRDSHFSSVLPLLLFAFQRERVDIKFEGRFIRFSAFQLS